MGWCHRQGEWWLDGREVLGSPLTGPTASKFLPKQLVVIRLFPEREETRGDLILVMGL